ncbi:MAG TPA: hypothetical protein VFF57_00485 [Hanamia sp.]|nr:hypothetical protein [Hanamia sp.]
MKKSNAGRKSIDPQEKKVRLPFYVKKKHVEKAKKEIQPIVDRINRN